MEDIRANGHILSDSIQHINEKGVKKSGLFPINSIILATTATIGEHALLKTEALSNQQFTCFTLKDEYKDQVDIDYIYWYFYEIDKWCKENTNSGSAFPTVDVKRLKEEKISFPKSVDEQRRIAKLLSSYDNMIASQEKLINIIERESVYEGSSSFNHPISKWSTVKLGDIVKIYSGKGIKKSEYLEDGEYPIIGANGEIGRTDKVNNTKKVLTTGRVGTIGTIQKVENAWITDNTLIIDIKDTSETDINYLYHILSLVDFKSITTGNAQPLVTSTRLKEVEISLPDINTQKYISSVFDNFDTMIKHQEDLIGLVIKEKENIQKKLLISY